MTETTGDDLIAARRFINLCQSNMFEIFSGKKLPLSDVVTRLIDIQSDAKLMRARSIFRAAQTVIDDLTQRQSVSECVNSVLTLQNLIRQYESGLSEIVPRSTSKAVPKSVVKPRSGPAIISDLARQTEAAKIMGPLIKYADKNDQKNLISLLSKAANDKPRAAIKSKQKFDVIMPNLTNHWLRLARANDKSISVSVAADDVNVDASILKDIQSVLLKLGNALVMDCVATPEARAAQQLSQSAHMAVTTRMKEDGLDILISCEGDLRPDSLNPEIEAGINSLGGQFTLSEEPNLVRAEMYRIPVSHSSADEAITGAAS